MEQGNIALVGTAAETKEGIKITAYISNRGTRAAKTDLSFFGDESKKNLFASQKGITVSAGQTKTAVFTVKPAQIKYNKNNATYLTISMKSFYEHGLTQVPMGVKLLH